MEIATLPSVGTVRLIHTPGIILVCINDLLRHLRACTPARLVACRHPSRKRAKALDGAKVLHFFDIPSAILLVATVRKRPEELQLRIVEGLASLAACCAPTITVDALAAPEEAAIKPSRPPGKTVREMLRKMGLSSTVSAQRAGAVVSAAYDGERHLWPKSGMIYADEKQLRSILSRYETVQNE